MQDTPKTTALMARTLYPDATQAARAAPCGAYCVLGALRAMARAEPPQGLEYVDRFPSVDAGAKAMQKLNPALPDALAIRAAQEVMGNNDAGLFDRAWCWAHRALSYGSD